MTEKDEKNQRRTDYVSRAADDTQRLLRELLQETEKLRAIASAAERENSLLQTQIANVTAELERHRVEQMELRKQLKQIEQESERFTEDLAVVEQRNSNLANLYVSSYQLHGTLDRGAVLEAIKEIVINLIGSEELAVFELSDDGRFFELVTSFGVDDSRYLRLGVSDHPIGRLAMTGETFIEGQSNANADADGLVVSVPLKLDGRVTGVISIFSLLPHKPGLQELDFELFDLLGTHAATALYCTGLQARIAAGAAA